MQLHRSVCIKPPSTPSPKSLTPPSSPPPLLPTILPASQNQRATQSFLARVQEIAAPKKEEEEKEEEEEEEEDGKLETAAFALDTIIKHTYTNVRMHTRTHAHTQGA